MTLRQKQKATESSLIMSFDHRKRLDITLAGEKPDRPPYALWRHFPVDDQDPGLLAKATIAFQDQFNFDIVKVSPPSSFCLKDWGAKDTWLGSMEGTREYLSRPVQNPEDWNKLTVLNPDKGYLGQQLQCLEYIRKAFSDHTPYIQTIFNPLAQAKNLVGPENLLAHLRQHPDAVHEGLKTIQKTTLRFISAAKKYGISGIFLAIQHASHQILTEDEYLEFGVRYDLPLLEAASDLWLNMVHLHGDAIMFNLITNYPVQILNWHDKETDPSLVDGLNQFPGCACGGIRRIESLVLGTPEQISLEIKTAMDQTAGRRLILGTGCVLPLSTPYGNINSVRQTVEALT